MPNWCSNYIEAYFGDKTRIDGFLARIVNADNEVDFGLLIPMPPILRLVHEGHCLIDGVPLSTWIEEGGSIRALTPFELEEVTKTGFNSWRDWSIANWGTKWNARDTYIEDCGKKWGTIEIMFDTAWSPPYQYFAKLLERYPDVEFEFRYRLEDDHSYPHEILPGSLEGCIREMMSCLSNVR